MTRLEKIKLITGIVADSIIVLGIILAVVQIVLPFYSESRQTAFSALSEINKSQFINAYIRVRSVLEAEKEYSEVVQDIYQEDKEKSSWRKFQEDYSYLLANFEYISKMIELGYMNSNIINGSLRDMMKVFFLSTNKFKKKLGSDFPFEASRSYKKLIGTFEKEG